MAHNPFDEENLEEFRAYVEWLSKGTQALHLTLDKKGNEMLKNLFDPDEKNKQSFYHILHEMQQGIDKRELNSADSDEFAPAIDKLKEEMKAPLLAFYSLGEHIEGENKSALTPLVSNLVTTMEAFDFRYNASFHAHPFLYTEGRKYVKEHPYISPVEMEAPKDVPKPEEAHDMDAEKLGEDEVNRFFDDNDVQGKIADDDEFNPQKDGAIEGVAYEEGENQSVEEKNEQDEVISILEPQEDQDARQFIYGSDVSMGDSIIAEAASPDDSKASSSEESEADELLFDYMGKSAFRVPDVPSVEMIFGDFDLDALRGGGTPEFQAYKAAYDAVHNPDEVGKFTRRKYEALFAASFEYLRRKDTEPTFTNGKERVKAACADMANTGFKLLETCKDPVEREGIISKMKIQCLRNRTFRNYLTENRLPRMAIDTVSGYPNENASAAMDLYCFALAVAGKCRNKDMVALVDGKMDDRMIANSPKFGEAMSEIEELSPIAADLKRRFEKCKTVAEFNNLIDTSVRKIAMGGVKEYKLMYLAVDKPLEAMPDFNTTREGLFYTPDKPVVNHLIANAETIRIHRYSGSTEFENLKTACMNRCNTPTGTFDRELTKASFDSAFEYLRLKDTTPTFKEGQKRVTFAVKEMANTGFDLLETCRDSWEREEIINKMKVEALRNKRFREYMIEHLPDIARGDETLGTNFNAAAMLKLYSFCMVVAGICANKKQDILISGKMDGADITRNSKYRLAQQTIANFETTTKQIAERLGKHLDEENFFNELSEKIVRHMGENGLIKSTSAPQAPEEEGPQPNMN